VILVVESGPRVAAGPASTRLGIVVTQTHLFQICPRFVSSSLLILSVLSILVVSLLGGGLRGFNIPLVLMEMVRKSGAFGCLVGFGRLRHGNPVCGDLGEGSEATRTSMIIKEGNKSRDLVCPVCGGSEWEWVDGPVVNGQFIVSRDDGG
jgi:hypothetical protein